MTITGEISQRKESVLIVDDAKLMRDFLRNMLTELGFTNFSEADNSRSTLQMFNDKRPDIIFLDIELYDENGLDILQELKAIDDNVKVAMVSAHSTIINVKKAMDCGAKGFIVKPYKPKKLVSTLKNLGIEIF